MQVEVDEQVPGRLAVRVTGDDGTVTTLTAIVPAGVGVPGASDEALVETVIEVLHDHAIALPDPLDVTDVLRRHPQVWAEVESRLD